MSMQKVLIVFFILSLIVLILVFPFKARIMAHVNFLDLKCFYSVKIWLIKILCGMAKFENDKLNVLNADTIFNGKYDDNFKENAKEIVKRLDVKKVELFFTGGFSDNSFSSAMLCGSVLSIIETLYAYLSLKYENVKMYKDIEPTFKENNFELTLDFVASISIFNIIVSNIKSNKKLKNLKEG